MTRSFFNLKTVLALVVSAALLLNPLALRAEEKYVPKYLPKGERVVIDGKEKIAFDLEDYKRLIFMDVKLQEYDKTIEPLQENNRNLVIQVANLQKNNSDLAQTIFDQQERIEALTTKWAKADLNWRKEKYKPKWGTTLSWGIACVAISFAVGTIAAQSAGSHMSLGDI